MAQPQCSSTLAPPLKVAGWPKPVFRQDAGLGSIKT